jgi:hypothetical protein
MPILGKLAHLDRVILMGKAAIYSLFSFVLTTVLLNAFLTLYRDHLPIAAAG